MENHYDVVIIGAGVVGNAIARELSKTAVSVAVLEKELDVAMGTSSRNSGVIHSGIHYKPGTLRARLNVEGNALMAGLCQDLKVKIDYIGKLTVAQDEEEVKSLYALKDQGEANGVPGLEILDPEAMEKIQPRVGGIKALHSPSTGIICPYSLTIALAENLRRQINGIPGMRCYGREIIGRPGVHDYDTTRLVFTARELGYSGYDIEQILRYEYNIQLELSDIFNVIALITIGHTEEMAQALADALYEIATTRKFPANGVSKLDRYSRKNKKDRFELPDWPVLRMSPRDAFVAPQKTVPFRESAGLICGEIVTPYPPGIPILRPGDEITQEIIDYIILEIEEGAHIQGPVDHTVNTIRVVEENGRGNDRKRQQGPAYY